MYSAQISQKSDFLQAVLWLDKLPGGAQSQLLLGSDQRLWVVKFKNNPQGTRILVNEFLASRLAIGIGLSTPEVAVISVDQEFIDASPNMCMLDTNSQAKAFAPGRNVASLFAGGLMPRQVLDEISSDQLLKTKNLCEFAGVLAFDRWVRNCDYRQVAFSRSSRSKHYRAYFIDQGYCFGGSSWAFKGAFSRGLSRFGSVYAHIKGWSDFEPWLSRIENMAESQILQHVAAIPREWYQQETSALEVLSSALISRRQDVRAELEVMLLNNRSLFPDWCRQKSLYQPGLSFPQHSSNSNSPPALCV